MEGFRKNAAETLRKTAKEERPEVLAEMQGTPEYWSARVDKLMSQGQKAEMSEDRTTLHWKVKNVYHGTDIVDLDSLNFAEESTIGNNAVYFTIDPALAMGYARLRGRERKTGEAHLYEATLTDTTLMNWAEQKTVEKLKNDFATFCNTVRRDFLSNDYEAFRQKYGVWEHIQNSTVLYALEKIEQALPNLNGGNVKTIAQGVMGIFFEKFVRDSGFDGVITIEGGDDAEYTAKAGVSVVLFNKDKIASHRSIDLNPIPTLSIEKTAPDLDEAAKGKLEQQWTEFWKRRFNRPQSQGREDVSNLKKGDLLHHLRYDEALLKNVLKSGILSGELGYRQKETRPEDAETHYCADFFVNLEDKSVAQYVEYANGTEDGESRIKRKRIESYASPKEQSEGIAVVVDPSRPELANLLQNAGTGLEAEKLAQFSVRFPYGDRPEITQRHEAVLVGIPANFITSLIVGGKISSDPEKLNNLKMIVAGSGLTIPILNTKGEVL